MAIELKKYCWQDGGAFFCEGNFDDEQGDFVIADYSEMVHGDHDMAGAEAARQRFAVEFPEFIAA